MLKPKTYNIGDTNIANLGTALEKNCREAAARKEPQWEKAGTKVGTEIWRIEKFHVVPWPQKQYGQFFSGDSYIVLYTYEVPETKALAWNVHFWLGDHTSQDEAGTAAYKTVELDDKMGGKPVQYREVCGHESHTFVNYFPTGIRVLEGGIESGFHHVKPEDYKPRLLQLRTVGKSIAVREVAMARSSLNSGDAFILDLGVKIIQWMGHGISIGERAKAASLAHAIEEEREGKTTVEVHIEGDGDLQEFWQHLEGGEGPVMPKVDAAAANKVDDFSKFKKVLYTLSDAGGKLEFKQVADGVVKQKDFITTDACIFDTGMVVFAWIGQKADAVESKSALQYASDYLTQNNRPPHTTIVRVLEGAENDLLKSFLDK